MTQAYLTGILKFSQIKVKKIKHQHSKKMFTIQLIDIAVKFSYFRPICQIVPFSEFHTLTKKPNQGTEIQKEKTPNV